MIDRCESCEATGSMFYQVSHPQTCTHWRCLRCLRAFLLEESGLPVLLTGVQLPTRSKYRTDVIATRRAVRAAADVLSASDATEAA